MIAYDAVRASYGYIPVDKFITRENFAPLKRRKLIEVQNMPPVTAHPQRVLDSGSSRIDTGFVG